MRQTSEKNKSGEHAGKSKASSPASSGYVPANDSTILAAGNMAVQNHFIQAKLAISSPDDPYEREADQVAAQVLQSSDGTQPALNISRATGGLQRLNNKGETAQGNPVKSKENRRLSSADSATSNNVSLSAAALNNATSNGRPLDKSTRAFFEPRFGRSFSDVQVHTGSMPNQTAQQINALAFTQGSNIVFSHGYYQPQSPAGKKLLAHELVHVVQQQGHKHKGLAGSNSVADSTTAPIQRELDPASEDDWDDIENPDQYNQLLNNSVERSQEVDQQVRDKGAPQTDTEKDAFAEKVQTLVRLNALGLMASHKATVEGTRDRILSSENRQQVDSGSVANDSSPFAELRKAAALVKDLRAALDRLEDYRSGLHIAHSRTIFRRGTIGDGFEDIVDNGAEFITSKQRQPLRESYAIAQRRGTSDFYWNFLYGATNYLKEIRQEQIFGVQQAISHVFQTYPMFSELDVEDIVDDDDLQSDTKLWEAIETAYADLIEEIDEAIVDIGSGDIHPFDLPRAVALTREGLPAELQTALDEARKDREVRNFTIGLGIALAFALLPVLGAIAGGVVAGTAGVAGGVAMFGVHLEDMLDRLSIAEASFDPYDDPLGVVAPTAFEWVLLGVEALLIAFGAYGVWRAVRVNPGSVQAPEELLGRVGERSGGVGARSNRPREMPYHNPPEMVSSDGRRIDVTRLDPNRKYLWAVDDGGSYIIAPENQPGFGVTEAAPQGRVVKHGDLTPGPGGQSRGSARAGGELYAEKGPDGKPTGRWILDNNSSYTFNRADGQLLPASSLDATKELLELYGTDVSRIVTRDVLAGRR